MAYLTLTEFRATAGDWTAAIPDAACQRLLDRASTRCDLPSGKLSYTHTGGDVPGDPPIERHKFSPDNPRFHTKLVPIRAIEAFKVVDGKNQGVELGVDFDPGDIIVDQDRGIGLANSFRLSVYGPSLNRLFWQYYPPYYHVTYRSGFDAGYLLDSGGAPTSTPSAPDGLVLPFPDWLKDACQLTAEYLGDQWLLRNNRGMGGLKRVVTGPFTTERDTITLTKNGLPPEAEALIRNNLPRAYGAALTGRSA